MKGLLTIIYGGGEEAVQAAQQIAGLSDIVPENEVSQWIPVSEQLPEEGVDVLVSVGENSDDCGYHVCLYRGDEWVRSESGYIFGVTHWMPLPPEPPEVK